MTEPLVLLVDDEPSVRETLAFILEMEGFRVAVAEDGEAAVAETGRLRPNVVLLDAMLPRLDGFEVARQLKSKPETQGVHIVMLTALGQQADRRRALDSGADFYIAKPFDEDELIALLRRLVG
jgi:two-component system phosphate regulon response regulator PhoB